MHTDAHGAAHGLPNKSHELRPARNQTLGWVAAWHLTGATNPTQDLCRNRLVEVCVCLCAPHLCSEQSLHAPTSLALAFCPASRVPLNEVLCSVSPAFPLESRRPSWSLFQVNNLVIHSIISREILRATTTWKKVNRPVYPWGEGASLSEATRWRPSLLGWRPALLGTRSYW